MICLVNENLRCYFVICKLIALKAVKLLVKLRTIHLQITIPHALV